MFAGFVKCLSKPAARAFARDASSSYAVNATSLTCLRASSVRIDLATSYPSIIGIPMSRKMTAGRLARAAASACGHRTQPELQSRAPQVRRRLYRPRQCYRQRQVSSLPGSCFPCRHIVTCIKLACDIVPELSSINQRSCTDSPEDLLATVKTSQIVAMIRRKECKTFSQHDLRFVLEAGTAAWFKRRKTTHAQSGF